MGVLVNGQWQRSDHLAKTEQGAFVRPDSTFRHWITPDGAPGPTGKGGFKAEAGRYHLYISLACPWAHRALIFRQIKGLEDMISLSVLNWLMLDEGWTFAPAQGVIEDPIHQAECLWQVYTASDPTFSGRVTVPVLWDKQRGEIVNNESADIIRMFNSAFDGIGARAGDYYPAALRSEIDLLNARIYTTVNNGVYRCGFATTQAAYEAAVVPLFDTLDWLDSRLQSQTYLCGDVLTEADWRLFTTLIRFDPVYYGHFKCNVRQIRDYRHLSRYLRHLCHLEYVLDTIDLEHIKGHYYASHRHINPTGIIPLGPDMSDLIDV